MRILKSNDLRPLESGLSKYNIYENQLEVVYETLLVEPMTMKELDVHTGIMRENICRYIKKLRDNGMVQVIQLRKCKITGHSNVMVFSANSSLFVETNQLSLF